tara:strand:+ start:1395 stop:1628 length:234 start_codon:yes stop_codon:yes gene_type:complete
LISFSVPSAVREAIDGYRAECTNEGGELELDGDEISKLWTDEGEESYVIHAAFTCGDLAGFIALLDARGWSVHISDQ